jgi:hypothetical protein
MSRPIRPLLVGLALLSLLCTAPRPAAALIEIEAVSPARAKELGITVQAQPRPAEGDVRVQVRFKATKALKGLSSATLELAKGGKRLLWAPLLPGKPARDSAPEDTQLEFYVDPDLLPEASVMIIVYGGGIEGSGYQLSMKNFLPQAESR